MATPVDTYVDEATDRAIAAILPHATFRYAGGDIGRLQPVVRDAIRAEILRAVLVHGNEMLVEGQRWGQQYERSTWWWQKLWFRFRLSIRVKLNCRRRGIARWWKVG